jgi:hypothetical protein
MDTAMIWNTLGTAADSQPTAVMCFNALSRLSTPVLERQRYTITRAKVKKSSGNNRDVRMDVIVTSRTGEPSNSASLARNRGRTQRPKDPVIEGELGLEQHTFGQRSLPEDHTSLPETGAVLSVAAITVMMNREATKTRGIAHAIVHTFVFRAHA